MRRNICVQVVEWANGTDGVTLFVNGMVRRKDFIRSCSLVNGHGVKAPPCPKPQYYVTQLGVCYTMSAEIHTTPASPNSGIMFELDVHQDEYSSEVNSKAVGAKVRRDGTNRIFSVYSRGLVFCFERITKQSISTAQQGSKMKRQL